MALSHTIRYHSISFDLRNYLAIFAKAKVASNPQAEARVEQLERAFAQYLGMRHALAFPFARTALYFVLKSRSFDRDSEIIMPPITIKPMMDAVLALGLKPIFVDIDRETLCFDPAELERAVNHKTRAILITYLFGIVPDVQRLVAMCREHGLFVVEDFSHNLNAEHDGRKLGTFGDVGIYSCSATKTFDAYGGGLAVTNDEAIATALRDAKASLGPTPVKRLRGKILNSLIWNAAKQKLVWTLATFPLIRIIRNVNPVMEQKLTGARLGLQPSTELPKECFERFTQRQADAGLALLYKVSAQDTQRIANVDEIKESMPEHGLIFPRSWPNNKNVYWQFVVYPADKDRVQKRLASRGIDSGTTKLSLISGLGIYPEHEKPCPNAEYVKYNALFVPAHPRLTCRDLEHVKSALKDALGQTS